jgi:phospholipid/cholesterol/gamma-HCH transport system substrate-binding protein
MPPTTRNIGFSQLRVGIFVMIALALLAFLIINSSGEFNPFERRMRLKARFASADGLREGAEVQLAGVHIGQVEEVRFLPPDTEDSARIEAVMSVSEQLDGRPVTERIRTDSTAQLIATSVLANDKMINITPGTARGDKVQENHVLDSSTSISINQLTQTGNELLNQINKLAVPTNEILNKANRGEGTLGRIVNDEALYNNLDATVSETRTTMLRLQNTIDRINRGEGTAGKLLNDSELYNSLNRTTTQLEQIARDLRAGRGSAGKFLSSDELYNEARATILEVRSSVGRLTQVADTFDTIARDLNEGKGSAGKFLKDEQLYNEARDALARFNTTAGKLDVIITDVQSGKGTIGRLLTDETLYNNANQTMANVNQLSSEGTKLIYDFRQNPKKYLTIKFRLF